MKKMTSRERLTAVYEGKEPDRVPIRVWGVDRNTKPMHPSYAPVIEAAQAKTDLVAGWSMPSGLFLSATDAVNVRVEEGPSDHEEFEERTTTYETPAGPLTQVHLFNREGKPGYAKKHLIETEEDAERFLSIPYVPVEGDVSSFFEVDAAIGDRGIIISGMGGHPMYAVNALTGSEVFAYWSVEKRDLLIEIMDVMYERCANYLKYLLEHGVGPFFGYVGPELCIPPLQSVKDFYDFVVAYDKKLVALVHESGGYVWCHSHGSMSPVLEGFMEIGVDCLNPLEPPPWGDITLTEAKARTDGKLVLEGNIEKHELYYSKPEEIRERVIGAIQDAGPGGRLILCPSSGVQEWPTCDERTVQNFLMFIETGLEFGKYPIR